MSPSRKPRTCASAGSTAENEATDSAEYSSMSGFCRTVMRNVSICASTRIRQTPVCGRRSAAPRFGPPPRARGGSAPLEEGVPEPLFIGRPPSVAVAFVTRHPKPRLVVKAPEVPAVLATGRQPVGLLGIRTTPPLCRGTGPRSTRSAPARHVAKCQHSPSNSSLNRRLSNPTTLRPAATRSL
jgi:hypothetical protein